MLWIAAAWAGPNTAMVGFERDPEAILAVPTRGTRCFARARFCVLEFEGPPPLDTLRALEGVRYAEPDLRIESVAAQADAAGTTDCPDLWDLDAIGVSEVWAQGHTGGPVIAVADGGFLASHEEIADRIDGQWDYGDGDATANLEWDVGVPAHGTFIASIVAGNADNGVGRAGVMPDGELNLLKIADSSGAMYFSYAASALADVADGDLGIRAVNYSIASSTTTDSFRDAVVALGEVGVVLVAAAGNCGGANCWDADNDAHPLYPANFGYEHVVTVAGSVQGGGFNTWSHYGASSVDLAAPGVDICAAGVASDSDYYASAGTSYAAPIVAAAIGLLDSAHPDLTTTEVARVLRASAVDHADWAGKTRSGGVLNVERAVATAVPRLGEPADVDVDQAAVLTLAVRNVGGQGSASLVLHHGAGFEVGSVADWQVAPFSIGETLELPDAGPHTATAPGTLLTRSLDAHEADTVEVVLLGREVGSWPVLTRLVLASDGADYLNAPYTVGQTDPTGFLAHELVVEVSQPAPPDSSVWSDSAPPDSPPPDTESDPSDTPAPDEPGPVGCGCASGSPAGAAWLLGVLALVRRRGAHARLTRRERTARR